MPSAAQYFRALRAAGAQFKLSETAADDVTINGVRPSPALLQKLQPHSRELAFAAAASNGMEKAAPKFKSRSAAWRTLWADPGNSAALDLLAGQDEGARIVVRLRAIGLEVGIGDKGAVEISDTGGLLQGIADEGFLHMLAAHRDEIVKFLSTKRRPRRGFSDVDFIGLAMVCGVDITADESGVGFELVGAPGDIATFKKRFADCAEVEPEYFAPALRAWLELPEFRASKAADHCLPAPLRYIDTAPPEKRAAMLLAYLGSGFRVRMLSVTKFAVYGPSDSGLARAITRPVRTVLDAYAADVVNVLRARMAADVAATIRQQPTVGEMKNATMMALSYHPQNQIALNFCHAIVKEGHAENIRSLLDARKNIFFASDAPFPPDSVKLFFGH